MANARTDVHRPSAINPEEYDFVSADYFGPRFDGFGDLAYQRGLFSAHMEKTGGRYSTHEHGGDCHICGARANYIAKFWHRPTNAYINTGFDCAEKMQIGDATVFRHFKTRIAKGHEFQTGKNKAQRMLNDAGLADVWNMYTTGDDFDKFEENTIRNIVQSVIRYGNLSDAQTKYIRTLMDKIVNRKVVEEQRKEQHAVAKEIPTVDARIDIVGKVVSVKAPDYDSAFPSWKMLVQHEDGWKVWGTIPSNLPTDSLKDCKVSFKARVRVSPTDTKFGFFTRPTSAEIVEQEGSDEIAA
jgi:hypothetical protein